jgi:hypothetical protein
VWDELYCPQKHLCNEINISHCLFLPHFSKKESEGYFLWLSSHFSILACLHLAQELFSLIPLLNLVRDKITGWKLTKTHCIPGIITFSKDKNKVTFLTDFHYSLFQSYQNKARLKQLCQKLFTSKYVYYWSPMYFLNCWLHFLKRNNSIWYIWNRYRNF